MKELSFKPTNYQVTYTVDFEKFTFSAEEVMTFSVVKATKVLTLDVVALSIDACQFEGEDIAYEVDEKKHTLTITLPKTLPAGEYAVTIHFSGAYKDQHAGWYRASYMANGEKKYMLTSHFEAADARRALPCVDHPNYKATFSITFVMPESLEGLSNMPIASVEEIGNGMKRVVFEVSPKMSTYLLYLGIGDFEYVEDAYRDVMVRGVAVKGKAEYTKFAIEVTKKTLEFFEDYFGVPYPLPKMDLIADPDFAMGAMEQWGAITFRETRLLVYPGKTSLAARQRCAETVAHELAHQWFGNLVTMKWWDNLWLNESFATVMAYKTIEVLYPEWDLWTEYVEDTVFDGMGLDVLASSHPVVQPLEDVSEVESRFDEITYDKGGSVLRMLEGYVGKEAYREGLQAYIKKFAYANAQGEDLWGAIQEASGKPVTPMMESFLTQSGFPQVQFTRDGDTVIVSQSQFLLNQDVASEKIWDIPISIKDVHGKEYAFLLHKQKEEVRIPVGEIVATNTDYMNFYVSSCDGALVEEMRKNKEHMNAREKLGFIHDLGFLAKGCVLPMLEYLNVIENFFGSEQDPSVLGYLLGQLEDLHGLVPTDAGERLLGQLARRSLELFGYRPKEGESSHVPAMRIAALYILGMQDDTDVIDFAKQAFEEFLIDEASLHADLRGVVYALAAWQSSENHKKLLSLYKEHAVEEEKTKFLAALGYSKEVDRIQDVLSLALTPEVRFVNLIYLNPAFQRNPHMKPHAFQWLDTNWDLLMELSGGGMGQMLLRRNMKAILPGHSTRDTEEALSFLDKVTTPTLQQAKREVREEIENIKRFVNYNK